MYLETDFRWRVEFYILEYLTRPPALSARTVLLWFGVCCEICLMEAQTRACNT